MATIYYTGKADAVAQTTTVQVTAYDASTTYSLTVNGVDISTSGAGSIEATVSALVTAWNASTHPYFSPITAAIDSVSPSDVVSLTSDEAGFPFTVSSSVSGGSGTIGSATTTTAATGPNNWNDADNWSLDRVPDNGDDVIIAKPDARLAWGLDLSSESPTITFTSFKTFGNARVGLNRNAVATSADGSTTSVLAPEYREDYLRVAITTVEINNPQTVNIENTVNGPARMKIDNLSTGASNTTIRTAAALALDTNLMSIQLLFNSASADVWISGVRSGVGIGIEPGETGTVGDITIQDDLLISYLRIGSGITWSSLEVNNGETVANAAATMPAVTVNGGTVVLEGTQAVTAATVNGGELVSNTTGTVTTITQDGGSVDFHQSARARTVTTWNFNSGIRRIDDYVTITNDNRSGRIIETAESA